MASTDANVLDGRWYAALQRFSDTVLLSAVWAIACLPVVTAGPATAAMFAVVRGWDEGRDVSAVPAFARYFRENLRQGLISGLAGVAVASLLFADLVIAGALAPPIASTLGAIAAVAGVVIVATSVYLFPLMVTYDLPLRRLVRSALMFAIGKPATTLACLAVIAAAGAATYVFPLTPVLAGSLVAGVVYRWSMRAVAATTVRSGVPAS